MVLRFNLTAASGEQWEGVRGGEPRYAGRASSTIKDATMIDRKRRPPLQPHGHPRVAVAYLSSESANQRASIYYVTGYLSLLDPPPPVTNRSKFPNPLPLWSRTSKNSKVT